MKNFRLRADNFQLVLSELQSTCPEEQYKQLSFLQISQLTQPELPIDWKQVLDTEMIIYLS